MSEVPSIDIRKCDGCGLCVPVCTGHSLAIINKVAVIINPEACVWCTMCEAVCPVGAASCAFEIMVVGHTTAEG
jgi:NAD-dependent dihydropyrimidine dehydrogenase PreA subunit